MKKNLLRYSIFIIATILLYMIWVNGGERVYAKVIVTGIEKFTTKFSSISEVQIVHNDKDNSTSIFCIYPDRKNNITVEYCLPIILLLAWGVSLFFDKRIPKKYAIKLFVFNFIVIYILQIFFPLLLYNVSQSKIKSTSLFIGMQIFSFLIFFLIIKDLLLIRIKFSHPFVNQNKK